MRRESVIVSLFLLLVLLCPRDAAAKTSLQIGNCSRQTVLLCAYNSSDSSQIIPTTSVVLEDDTYVSDLKCDSSNGCQLRAYKGGGLCEQRRRSDEDYLTPGTPVIKAGTYTLASDGKDNVKIQAATSTSCGRLVTGQDVPLLNCSGKRLTLCSYANTNGSSSATWSAQRAVTNMTYFNNSGGTTAVAYADGAICPRERPKSDRNAIAQPVSLDAKSAYTVRWDDKSKSQAFIKLSSQTVYFREANNRLCKDILPLGATCESGSECRTKTCRQGKCGIPSTGNGPVVPSK